MQRQRGELVSVGEASPQALYHFTRFDQVNQLCFGQRSGRRSRLHGEADGAVLPAPHQPRQPASLQATERPVQAHHDFRRQHQTSLWQSPTNATKLANLGDNREQFAAQFLLPALRKTHNGVRGTPGRRVRFGVIAFEIEGDHLVVHKVTSSTNG